MDDVTIVIEAEGLTPRKITKIFPMNDGFAVRIPYHAANTGLLVKHLVDYQTTRGRASFDAQHVYTASTKAKLSFHLSGFVQFSGQGIVSGYDQETGKVKGLGLRFPQRIQILTGPAFGVTVWGLEDFDELKMPKAKDRIIQFKTGDFYHRGGGERNGYHLETFLMPKTRFASGAFPSLKGQIWRGHLPYISLLTFEHELRVIDLRDCDSFLGVMITKLSIGFTDRSGFTLNGPSILEPDRKTGFTLGAFYPIPSEFGQLKNAKSLDYRAPEESSD